LEPIWKNNENRYFHCNRFINRKTNRAFVVKCKWVFYFAKELEKPKFQKKRDNMPGKNILVIAKKQIKHKNLLICCSSYVLSLQGYAIQTKLSGYPFLL